MAATPTIFYLDTIPGERLQTMTLAGIRRYATARRWTTVSVPFFRSRPRQVRALFKQARPAGCVVECTDGRVDLPPELFGDIPVVYLHAPPTLYGGGIVRICTDNEAVARAAFRELSEGRPEAFAVIGFRGRRDWSDMRARTFLSLAAETGKPCFTLPWRMETVEERVTRLAPWLAALPRRCAVFAANDLTATEVIAAAGAVARRIPQDMTLLGVDNDERVCMASRPTLSSIQIDYERAGYLAARLLAETMTGQAGGVTTVGPLLTVRRESTRGAGRREPRILQAVERIRREACDGLSARDVVAAARGTRRLFELRFREAMGHSVLDEIQHVRLERIFTLLARTDTPLGAIASLCGWGSDVSLQRFFRSRTGMTMREWRARNRG